MRKEALMKRVYDTLLVPEGILDINVDPTSNLKNRLIAIYEKPGLFLCEIGSGNRLPKYEGFSHIKYTEKIDLILSQLQSIVDKTIENRKGRNRHFYWYYLPDNTIANEKDRLTFSTINMDFILNDLLFLEIQNKRLKRNYKRIKRILQTNAYTRLKIFNHKAEKIQALIDDKIKTLSQARTSLYYSISEEPELNYYLNQKFPKLQIYANNPPTQCLLNSKIQIEIKLITKRFIKFTIFSSTPF